MRPRSPLGLTYIEMLAAGVATSDTRSVGLAFVARGCERDAGCGLGVVARHFDSLAWRAIVFIRNVRIRRRDIRWFIMRCGDGRGECERHYSTRGRRVDCIASARGLQSCGECYVYVVRGFRFIGIASQSCKCGNCISPTIRKSAAKTFPFGFCWRGIYRFGN